MKRGRPFEKGNKLGRGRPRGSRNKRDSQAQQLLDEHGHSIIVKALAGALQGDSQLLRALLPFILRPPSDPPLQTGRLRVGTAKEISKSLQDILQGVASGNLTLPQAQALAALVEDGRHALETLDLDTRMRALEQHRSS